MAIERDTFLEILKDAYSAYYTIIPPETEDVPLAFRAEYKAQDELFFLVKSAKLWRNDKLEYAYAFAAERFDPETIERCIEWAWQDMLPRVKPHKEHQYTNAKVLFIADALDEASARAVKKARRSKSYGFFSLEGYSELITAAVDLSQETTVTNPAGYDLVKFFGKLFALRQEKA